MGIRLAFRLWPLWWTFRQSSGFLPYPGFLSSSCFQYLNLSSTGQLLWGRVSYSFCAMTPMNNSVLFCYTYLSIYTRYLYYMIYLRLSFLDLVFVKVQRTLLYSDNSFWSTIGINNYLLNDLDWFTFLVSSKHSVIVPSLPVSTESCVCQKLFNAFCLLLGVTSV